MSMVTPNVLKTWYFYTPVYFEQDELDGVTRVRVSSGKGAFEIARNDLPVLANWLLDIYNGTKK